jgi:hypothetical protein
MYDLWYSIGIAVMDPDLVKAMKAVPPKFDKVTRVITENGAVYSSNDQTAGLLEAGATTNMRSAIAAYLHRSPAAPPVSIFTAGKWCQFLTVGAMFVSCVQTAHTAFEKAAGNAPPKLSPSFPALLGLCLLDQAFCNLLMGNPTNPDLVEALGEFGVPAAPASPDLKTLAAFAGDTSFQNARDAMLSAADGCWATGCSEQFVFWAGKNEHAVL